MPERPVCFLEPSSKVVSNISPDNFSLLLPCFPVCNIFNFYLPGSRGDYVKCLSIWSEQSEISRGDWNSASHGGKSLNMLVWKSTHKILSSHLIEAAINKVVLTAKEYSNIFCGASRSLKGQTKELMKNGPVCILFQVWCGNGEKYHSKNWNIKLKHICCTCNARVHRKRRCIRTKACGIRLFLLYSTAIFVDYT